MAAELTISIRLFVDGDHVQLSVEGTFEKSGKPTKALSKDFREPVASWSKITIADFKRKIGNKALQTKVGGTFLGTLSKKPCKDTDTLESVGVLVDPKFTKTYDLAFEYDPSLDPARYHVAEFPTESTTTAAPSSAPKRTTGDVPSSDEIRDNQLLMEIHVENTKPGAYHVSVKGKSKHCNPSTDFYLGNEFESMRMSEFLEKLGDGWPKFERGGYFLGPKVRESFTARSKLDTIGITCKPGKSDTHKCVFDIDTTTKTAAKSSEPEKHVGAPPLKPGQLHLELTLSETGGTHHVHVRGSTEGFHKETNLDISDSVWPDLTVDHFLGKLDSGWPTFQFGGFLWSAAGKKAFLGDDHLETLGIKGSSTSKVTYHLILDVDKMPSSTSGAPKVTVTKLHTERVASGASHELQGHTQLATEFRLFVDSGYYFITLSSDEAHFKGDAVEFSVKEEEFKRMTIKDVIGKTGSRWLKLKEAGYHMTSHGRVAFTGSTKLMGDLGIKGDPARTVSHQLVFEIDTAPRVSPRGGPSISPRGAPTSISPRGAPSSTSPRNPAPTSHNPRRTSTGASSGATSSAGRAAAPGETFGVEFRIWDDSGTYQASFKGQCGDFVVNKELSVKVSEWNKLTLGQLLEKLGPSWPKVTKCILLQGMKSVAMNDTLASVGLTGHPTQVKVYQLKFDMISYPAASTKVKPITTPAARTEPQPASSSSDFIADNELGLSIRIFCDSGNHFLTITGKAKDFSERAEITVPEREWHVLTWGELKAQLHRFPPTHDGGTFLGPNGNSHFTNRDTLHSTGIRGDKSGVVTFNCILKQSGALAPAREAAPKISPRGSSSTTASTLSHPATSHTTTQTRSAAAHVRRTSNTTASLTPDDLINIELRMFIDNGNYELQVTAAGAYKATHDITVPVSKWRTFTLGDLKKKLGQKWPQLKPGCVYSTPAKVQVSDTQTLKEVGIDVSETGMKTFDLAFYTL